MQTESDLERAAAAAETAFNFREAIAARRKLTELRPQSHEARLAYARTLRRAGEPHASIAAYEEARRLGAPAVEVDLQIGAIHAEHSEHEQAERHLQRVLAAQPRHEDALCMLATVLQERGRFDEAKRLLERALEVRAAFPEALFNLGLALFELGDLRGASRRFAECFALNRGAPWSGAAKLQGNEPKPQFSQEEMAVNATKIRHDCEQLEYLLGLGRLPPQFKPVLEDYRALMHEMQGDVDHQRNYQFNPQRHPLVARTYKRPLYMDPGLAPEGPLVNPGLDARAIEERYLGSEPNLVAADGLVTPEALQALRRFCRESMIWNNIKPGYLGAYFYDGFSSELLLRLAHELRERLPGIIRGLPLQMMWGFKCDATLPGLGTHADAAAVNVNFWITENEANLDPQGGGLLVHTCDAPPEWGFNKFNSDAATINDYLDKVGSQPVRFAYRENRAVIFDSDLFHASDRPRFREGYLNRRINITLLYGSRY